MSQDATLRETGAEKAQRICPLCGAPMVVTESPYGSVTAYCPNHQQDETQTASAGASDELSLDRETGTDVEDHG